MTMLLMTVTSQTLICNYTSFALCALLFIPLFSGTMVAKAKSNTKKAQIACEAYEHLKERAIEAYQNELKKPQGKGAHTIAKDFINLYKVETGKKVKLCYLTLIRGAKGGRSHAAANAVKSWVTDDETDIIIQYITELGNHGFPLSHHRLKEHVQEMLRARLGDKFPTGGLGKQWTHCFVEKHSERIKMSWSTGLESKRGRAVNPNTTEAWFSLLQKTVTDYGIIEECRIDGNAVAGGSSSMDAINNAIRDLSKGTLASLVSSQPMSSSSELQHNTISIITSTTHAAALNIIPETLNECFLLAALQEAEAQTTFLQDRLLSLQASNILNEAYCTCIQGQLAHQEAKKAGPKGKGKLMGDSMPVLLTGDVFYKKVVDVAVAQAQVE